MMRYMVIFNVLIVLLVFAGCEGDSGSKKTATATSTVDANTSDISFNITAVTGAALSTAVNSGDINVTGIVGTVSVSLSSGILVKNGTSLTTLSTTMTEDDTIAVILTSSSSYNTAVTATLTIGGVAKIFSVTTLDENVPDAFSFTAKTGATTATAYDSNTITIAGLDVNSSVTASFSHAGVTAVVVVNGTIVNQTNEGSFTLTNGDTVLIRMTSSASYSTPVSSTLTVGSLSKSYSITTASAPTLSISPSSLSLSYGGSGTLSATVTPSTIDNNITWTSSNTAVATVGSTTGVVTAVGAGTATITAVAELAGYADINASITVAVSVSLIIDEKDMFIGATSTSFVDVVVDRSDSLAYLANSSDGIVVVDLNTSTLSELGSLNLPSYTEGLALNAAGTILYTATGYDGLNAIDVSTSSSPTVLDTYNTDYTSTSKFAWSVSLSSDETVAYVAHCTGVDVFDVSTPTAITRLDEHNITDGNCSVLAFDYFKYDIVHNGVDKVAYVAYGEKGVVVLNTLNKANLVTSATYSSATCGNARSVALSKDEKTLYVACGSDGVDIVNVSDPVSPAFVKNYALTNSTAVVNDVRLSADGSQLYVAHGVGLDILDVTTPSSPSAIVTYPSNGNAYAVYPDSNDTYFYLGDGLNGLLKLQLTYQ